MSSSESESEFPDPKVAGSNPDSASNSEGEEETETEVAKTFEDLGLVDVLVENCSKLGWKKPSKIQAEAIPIALEGKDVIGLAETGSGKTGAFALPILQVCNCFPL